MITNLHLKFVRAVNIASGRALDDDNSGKLRAFPPTVVLFTRPASFRRARQPIWAFVGIAPLREGSDVAALVLTAARASHDRILVVSLAPRLPWRL